MKYCQKCGKELVDEAAFCDGCGFKVGGESVQKGNSTDLVTKLSERVKTNAIIWMVIGVLQIIGAFLGNFFVAIIGVVNIISSVKDLNYSKTVAEQPVGIVAKFEPLATPIIVLVYNLLVGGFIGVIGSIHYFVAIRSFVMENKTAFAEFE